MDVRLPPRLLAISPGDLGAAVEPFVERVRRAADAGLRGLLLREPGLSDRALLALAERVAPCLPPDDGGWLAVHDRPHLARVGGFAGVHLGWRSVPAGAARAQLPADVALGLSTHAGDDPEGWTEVDYVTHGPVLETPSKARLATPPAPVGFQGLALAARASPVPVIALGGLAPEHGAGVRASGAHGAAAIRSLFAAADTAAAVRAWLSALAGRQEVGPA